MSGASGRPPLAGRPAIGLIAGLLLALGAAAPAGAGRQSISLSVTEPEAASLTGDLYMPAAGGPFPAVILLHGCGGVAPNAAAWAERLEAEGYAALVLDSFRGRGLRSLCGDSRPLTPAARAPDVFAAAARLRTIAGIDGDRIAAMGFSHGGSTALAAWRMQSLQRDRRIKATVALYPGCGTRPPPREAGPLLLLVGGQDDWTPAENCQKLAEAARRAGEPVTIVVYPDARHAFDAANLRKLTWISVARGGKGASIEYNPKAHEDARGQVRQFLAAELAR